MILHVHSNCSERTVDSLWRSQWFDLKQFIDGNKIRDFFTMNSKLRIRFYEFLQIFTNFYKFVHTNFVFVRKTSNLFVRIREGFQHVMLQMACTVGLSNSNYNYNYNLNFFKHGGASRRKHCVFHTAV